jgi:hypothetical protein
MHRPLLAATTAATAVGAVLAAGLIVGPAWAAGPGESYGAAPATTCDGTGRQARAGQGMGAGTHRVAGPAGAGMQMGNGMGRGPGAGGAAEPLAGLVKGTLTADQKVKLAGMAEEEKLAHDVYVALATSSKDPRFVRIATAETQHLSQIRALLARYGIADPTAGKADSQFASTTIQQHYSDLVARGSASLSAALAVGRDIENEDISALATAGSGVSAPDVDTVYARLTDASGMHLRAFGG